MAEKEEVKYPYLDKEPLFSQVRKNGWLIKNKEGITLYISKKESYSLCFNYFFDGFSIPWWIKWLIPKNQDGLILSAFHDSWCEFKYILAKHAHYLFGFCLLKMFKFKPKWHGPAMAKGVKIGGPRWKELQPRPEWA